MVFELQFLDWLQTLQTPILNEIMKAVTHLGDAGALWIILAAVLLAFPKTRKSGAIVAAALIVDLVLCNGILKNIFARTRPFVAVLIAFSRMYLYVHYPTDILGGIIVGIVSGLVGAYIIKRVQKRGVVPN